ncbi:MAG: lipid kinase [Desulfosarcina sp.]
MAKTKRALIVINRLARQGDADLQPVVDTLHGKGIDSILIRIGEADAINVAIGEYDGRVDRIIIGGGDGTLSASLPSVIQTHLPLGILPLGTANDLARTLKIPTSLTAAAEIIAAGHIRHIDLGRVNGRYFFNAASIGLAVRVTHSLTHRMKKKWGVAAYPLALVEAFRANRPFRARVDCDGKIHRLKSIQITIGNGRHYGGGMAVRQDAQIDDHRLHCFSLAPQTLWELLKAAPSIFRGTFENRERVWLMDGSRFEITTRKPKEVDADGEMKAHTPARFSLKKEALPVFVPGEAIGNVSSKPTIDK